ncbi:hypothetical protein Sru01_12660 [Sphaerisporangium rufum]|uniref:Uncharacterized protein n=1 Tax=Sphaerisporangium rufum TaxID=1381558 RepID=A0A919QY46_9ACTN|nr:hypothetical protein Sru01_12660 [Sphaerisporangium rufum]
MARPSGTPAREPAVAPEHLTPEPVIAGGAAATGPGRAETEPHGAGAGGIAVLGLA